MKGMRVVSIHGTIMLPGELENGKMPDTKQRYLLCPQCGTHRFFVKDENGENVYFHVDWAKAPFPTETSGAELSGIDFTVVYSTGCSWKGSFNGLVRYLR